MMTAVSSNTMTLPPTLPTRTKFCLSLPHSHGSGDRVSWIKSFIQSWILMHVTAYIECYVCKTYHFVICWCIWCWSCFVDYRSISEKLGWRTSEHALLCHYSGWVKIHKCCRKWCSSFLCVRCSHVHGVGMSNKTYTDTYFFNTDTMCPGATWSFVAYYPGAYIRYRCTLWCIIALYCDINSTVIVTTLVPTPSTIACN